MRYLLRICKCGDKCNCIYFHIIDTDETDRRKRIKLQTHYFNPDEWIGQFFEWKQSDLTEQRQQISNFCKNNNIPNFDLTSNDYWDWDS